MFAAAAVAAGPVCADFLGAHAAYAYAALHVDPRRGCVIVGGRMAHRHLLGVLELAHWRRGNAAWDLGCILSDRDGTPRSPDYSDPTHSGAHTGDVGTAVGAEAHVADVVKHDVGDVPDFGAVDAGSVVGDVVYVATASSVVYVAASCGSAGGELDRCPSRLLSYGCASFGLAAGCMLLLQCVVEMRAVTVCAVCVLFVASSKYPSNMNFMYL